jgi:hypothetical protein
VVAGAQRSSTRAKQAPSSATHVYELHLAQPEMGDGGCPDCPYSLEAPATVFA